jgi:hypothetical protein
MSRIAHFDSWSSAETIKQIADSKKGRPSRNIYLFHMTQKFYATDSQTIKKLIFFCNPLRRPSSYLPSALGVHPPVPAPLAAKGQVPLQRLPRDNLETSRSSCHVVTCLCFMAFVGMLFELFLVASFFLYKLYVCIYIM